MKKRTSIIFALILAAFCFVLVACGSKSEGSAPSADSKYIGTWKAVRAEFAGKQTPMDEVLEGGVFILDLKADGTAVVTTDKTENGTWTEKSDGVHVKAGETDADFPAQGDNLVIDVLGVKIIFEKQ